MYTRGDVHFSRAGVGTVDSSVEGVVQALDWKQQFFCEKRMDCRNKINKLHLVACMGNDDVIGITKTEFNIQNEHMVAECHIQRLKLCHIDSNNGKESLVALYVQENWYKNRWTRLVIWVEYLERQEK